MHARVCDPSLYVQGYVPKPDDWDHLEFYGPAFGVRITPFRHDEDGYSTDQFTRTDRKFPVRTITSRVDPRSE
ncbi:MAG: hypothetical protein ABIF71_07780 [Planctomycetota bacterium]